ncbi:MAG: WG repeat-containing protein [bacterium]|nr:WG repeat-containing protein [bacterium]
MFREGLAPAANTTNLFGYIDTSGNWVITPQYYNAGPFIGGRAFVMADNGTALVIDRRNDTVLAYPLADNTDGRLFELGYEDSPIPVREYRESGSESEPTDRYRSYFPVPKRTTRKSNFLFTWADSTGKIIWKADEF